MLNTTKYPLSQELNRPIRIALQKSAMVLRGGFDFATGGPALWVLYNPEDEGTPVFHDFVIVTTGTEVPDGSTHHGMWWAAADTFHIFELESDPALLTNVFAEENDDGG